MTVVDQTSTNLPLSSASASSPFLPSPGLPSSPGSAVSPGNVTINAQNALDIGKAAEHLVCADLLLSGTQAFLSDQGLRYDVIADVEGRLVRIQVKATGRPRLEKGRRLPGYRFEPRVRGVKRSQRLTNADCDLIAFVALDIRVVAYLAVFEVGQACEFYPPGHDLQGRYRRLRQQPIDGFPFSAAYSRFLAGPDEWAAGAPLNPARVPLQIDGVTKTVGEWATEAGISVGVLEARLRTWEPRHAVTAPPQHAGGNPGRMISFNGELRTMSGWAKHVGLSQGCLWRRIMVQKWPLERALTTPARRTQRAA